VSADGFYGPGYEDSSERVPDIEKARRLLGWMPLQSLSDMLPPIVDDYVKRYAPRIDGAAARRQPSVA
jgi:UDP-apiose/xylose synthase